MKSRYKCVVSEVCLLFLFFFIPLQGLIAETSFYEFGPKTDKVVVFTASLDGENQATTATAQLQRYAQRLSYHEPDIHIIIAITKNDISELPAEVSVRQYAGIKSLIKKLNEYPNAAVCLIAPRSSNDVRIITGTSKGTTPAWFLKAVYTSLNKKNIPLELYTHSIVFHRLGWLPDDPVLQLYNEGNIPTIKIETGFNLSDIFPLCAAQVIQYMSNEWDTHYFVVQLFKKLILINEEYIVIVLIVSLIVFLLWVMFFSFLSGDKRIQHLKDLAQLCWMPCYVFLVNLVSFSLGTKITEALFYLRFSSINELAAFPLTALSIKYVSALFFIFAITALNTFVPLPANRFIYGFMAHVSCLLNIFIFSFIDLSFSLIFMMIYFVSFAAYHVKTTMMQMICIICFFLPIFPFIMHVVHYRYHIFPIVFFINSAPACIFVPFDLFLIKLSLSIKGRKTAVSFFRLPIECKVMGTIALLAVVWLFVMPTRKGSAHNQYILIHHLDEYQSKVLKKYTHSSVEEKLSASTYEIISNIPVNADAVLAMNTSFENYFERSIGSISLHSPLNIAAFSVTIHAMDDIAIFESNLAFERNALGDTATFVSEPHPHFPVVIRFSGKKNAMLRVSVVLWSRDNPFNIRFNTNQKNTVQDITQEIPFLLKIEKTIYIAAEDKKIKKIW